MELEYYWYNHFDLIPSSVWVLGLKHHHYLDRKEHSKPPWDDWWPWCLRIEYKKSVGPNRPIESDLAEAPQLSISDLTIFLRSLRYIGLETECNATAGQTILERRLLIISR